MDKPGASLSVEARGLNVESESERSGAVISQLDSWSVSSQLDSDS